MRFPIVKKRKKKSGAKYNKNTIKSEARRDVSGNLRSRDYRDEVVNIFLPLFFMLFQLFCNFPLLLPLSKWKAPVKCFFLSLLCYSVRYVSDPFSNKAIIAVSLCCL